MIMNLVGVIIGFGVILGLLRLLLARCFGRAVAPGDLAERLGLLGLRGLVRRIGVRR